MDRNDVWLRFIEELKSRNDIVNVVGSYVNLERKGSRYWACCPFHHEKTPSFCITPEMQRYKCYGCGASGDVINFVMQHESVEFMAAVEILAKRVGLEIPKTVGDKGLADRKKRKQTMAEICLEAARFYRETLLSEKGGQALAYLKKRGFSQKTIAKFGLGLSPDWNSLKNRLAAKGFDLETAYECSVLDKKNGRYYDFLAERLIVPIINSMGDVIAFGGRSMQKNVDFAKYKNTKQTDLFDKSKNLFAINLISKKKKKEGLDKIIVVEGYMDAIALHQAGFDYAVASMGTSLTKEQAKLMKRYVDKVFICYDGDSAGTKGTLRGLDILKAEGLDVRVMSMPDGVDPDELILNFGVKAFEKLMDEALPLTDYKLKILKSGFDFVHGSEADKNDAKRKYASAALKVIRQLNNLVESESYLIKLSKETGFSLDWLKNDLLNIDENLPQKQFRETPQNQSVQLDQRKKALYYILACMLAGEEYAKIDFTPDVSDDEFLQKSFDYVIQCEAQNKKPVSSILSDLFDGGFEDNIDYLADTVFTTTIENKKQFDDCVKLVKKSQIDDEITRLNALYEKEADSGERQSISEEIQKLFAEKKSIDKR